MKSIVVTVTLSLILTACAGEQHTTEHAATASTAASAEAAVPATTTTPAAVTQEQTIDVAGAFSPASVTIPANTPVRLHFRRGAQDTCGDEIVFPELNLRKKIAANETVTFDIPAQQARTLNFACGMDMMKGTVVVQ